MRIKRSAVYHTSSIVSALPASLPMACLESRIPRPLRLHARATGDIGNYHYGQGHPMKVGDLWHP